MVDVVYFRNFGELPGLNEIWGLAVLVPILCGAAVTLGAGGATLPKRVIGAAFCGGVVGVLYTAVSAMLGFGEQMAFGEMATFCLWRVFLFVIFSAIGVVLTELKLPEPDRRRAGDTRSNL